MARLTANDPELSDLIVSQPSPCAAYVIPSLSRGGLSGDKVNVAATGKREWDKIQIR